MDTSIPWSLRAKRHASSPYSVGSKGLVVVKLLMARRTIGSSTVNDKMPTVTRMRTDRSSIDRGNLDRRATREAMPGS
jgi:hypothetical protein